MFVVLFYSRNIRHIQKVTFLFWCGVDYTAAAEACIFKYNV